MPLWENDGSASDAVNALTEVHGDGAIMDSMRQFLPKVEERRNLALKRDHEDIMERNAGVERVAEEETGLIPAFSIPVIDYHSYAADFRMAAAEQGIELEGNGYECWHDDHFVNWYLAQNPHLRHQEAKRNATVIVEQAGKDAMKGAVNPGGLVLA
jgi:hypothetical protein